MAKGQMKSNKETKKPKKEKPKKDPKSLSMASAVSVGGKDIKK